MSGIVGEPGAYGHQTGRIGGSHYAMLGLDAPQTVSNGAVTKVLFDNIRENSTGSISSNGWLVPESGIYQVILLVGVWDTSNDLQSCYVHFRVDAVVKSGGYSIANLNDARHEQASSYGVVSALRGQIIYGYGAVTSTSDSPSFWAGARWLWD